MVFKEPKTNQGMKFLTVKGWDYVSLIDTYEKAGEIARNEHVPVIIHVQELTQPQGHSTRDLMNVTNHQNVFNGKRIMIASQKMRAWIIENNISDDAYLTDLEKNCKIAVRQGKNRAWQAYLAPIEKEKEDVLVLLGSLADQSKNKAFINNLIKGLKDNNEPVRKDVISAARKGLRYTINENSKAKETLRAWINTYFENIQPKYSSHLYSESSLNPLKVNFSKPEYDVNSEKVDGRIILRDNFDKLFEKYPEAIIFGEDSGNIGDVNQGLEGLQEKYGALRIADAGIREATILGQGIGMAMRGLRPIAEIQYLDYLLYALQIISDDLSTLHYRTLGRQKAPMIIRTRGHRLEGIWHSGSQMSGILNLIRGVYFLVPRNMTVAAGFYNTLMESDQPALIVECLNGYRLKEKKPSNLGEFKLPLGVVETLKKGTDITLVSYGSTLRIVEQVAKELMEVDINAEVIDIQSLMPFDINHDIVESIKKTNRLLIIDEDIPGGASSYILNEVLDNQNAYEFLDSKPKTLTAKEHRPAYGSDGDYFSKPSAEDIFEAVYAMMHESNPLKYPKLR